MTVFLCQEMATGDDIPIEERNAAEMGAYLKEGVVADGNFKSLFLLCVVRNQETPHCGRM